MRLEEFCHILCHETFHAQRKSSHILVSCIDRHILHGGRNCCRLAGSPLRSELPALLLELLKEHVSVLYLLLILYRQDSHRHEQVLVSLCLDLRYQFSLIIFAKRRIRIFSRPGVLCTVRYVFRRLVYELETLVTQPVIDFGKPRPVKCAVVQLIHLKRGKSRYHSLSLVIK